MIAIRKPHLIVPPSEFEHTAARRWQRSLESCLPAEVSEVEVLMSNTRSMDSCGLAALLDLHEQLAQKEGRMTLVNPTAAVMQLLELTGVHRILNVAHERGEREEGALRPILVVEDDSIIRSVAGLSLKPLGRPVLFAENGHEALAIARKERPAVIVLDYMLPLMDGTETLKRMKQDPRTADIPVVIMSANTRVANGLYDAFEGAACFVSKPFSPTTLRTEVHRLLEENLQPVAA